MATQFRINGTTYSLLHLGSRVTTPSYCYRQGGITYYTPLLTSRSQTIGNYTYNASSPTVCVRYNNTTYYAAKSRTASSDIPAGTYTPSAFENLIKGFISNNGSRIVYNSFSVEVNGQTYNVPKYRSIYYTVQYGGEARFVSFNGSQRRSTEFQSSFYDKGVYCTYFSYGSQGDQYYKYNIKVNTGINFS